MGTFRFKKFDVINERSAMKVNTDGVLLGAAMTISETDRNLLDIGTGTGTIALMAAQRLSELSAIRHNHTSERCISPCFCGAGRMVLDGADMMEELREMKEDNGAEEADRMEEYRVDAIDIDEPSATEAADNFRNSPWNERLTSYNMALEAFAAGFPERQYDLIFSNPPYFVGSLTAPDERKSTARHTSDGLSYKDIFDFAEERLTENGRVALVLPADQENDLCRYARMTGLHLFRIVRVRTVPRKSPTRIIAEFSRKRCSEPQEELLTIQDEGKYTGQYLSLTHDFYLFA